MHTDDHPVEAVLKDARRFMVPLYQRQYQWGDARLEPFWEDVSVKASEVLDGESKFEHYMGALILSPVDQGSEIGRTPLVQVVDGQQRLTTFQLFLAALREVARDRKHDDFIEQANGYLFNTPQSKDQDPLTKFKLTPTPYDRGVFQDLIKKPYDEVKSKYRNLFWGQGVPKNTPFRAFRAYYLFRRWIDHFLTLGPDHEADFTNGHTTLVRDLAEDIDSGIEAQRLEALLSAVLDRMKLVVITLGDSDDAQVIFETLNSRGEQLLAMDLVRNNIFHRAEKQQIDVESLYKELWEPFNDAWWKESAPNARPKRPRLDHFLAHVLVAQTGDKISVRELYAEYRAFAVPKGTPRFSKVQDELKLLEDYVPLYQSLEGRVEANAQLDWLGRKLRTWQVTTAYPVALQIGAANIDAEERGWLTKLIYSFLARRAICGLTTKNLNKVFQAIAAKFHASGVSVGVFQEYFSDKTGDSLRFPDDAEFRQGVLSGNAYSITPRSRLVDILSELEYASRPAMAENISLPNGLWIEHVMPQTWTDEWPFEDGATRDVLSDDPEVLARSALLHSLGNLTLLTSSLNISSGNSCFKEKRDNLKEQSGLFLNKWFLSRERWTEKEIVERGEALAVVSRQVWPNLDAAVS